MPENAIRTGIKIVNICEHFVFFPLPVVWTLSIVCNNKEFNQFIPMGTAFRPCHRRALLERKHHLQYRSRVGVCWYPKLHSSKRQTEPGFLWRNDPSFNDLCFQAVADAEFLPIISAQKIATLNTYCIKSPFKVYMEKPKTEISQFSKTPRHFWPTNPFGACAAWTTCPAKAKPLGRSLLEEVFLSTNGFGGEIPCLKR